MTTDKPAPSAEGAYLATGGCPPGECTHCDRDRAAAERPVAGGGLDERERTYISAIKALRAFLVGVAVSTGSDADPARGLVEFIDRDIPWLLAAATPPRDPSADPETGL